MVVATLSLRPTRHGMSRTSVPRTAERLPSSATARWHLVATVGIALADILPIFGPRINIAPLEVRHIAALWEIESDPVVKRFLDGPVGKARDVWISEMSAQCPSYRHLAVCRNSGGELLGRASLARDLDAGPTAELRIVLGQHAFMGRKERLGREVARLLIDAAFGPLGLREVTATVDPENVHSLALVEAFGFESIGVGKKGKLLFALRQ